MLATRNVKPGPQPKSFNTGYNTVSKSGPVSVGAGLTLKILGRPHPLSPLSADSVKAFLIGIILCWRADFFYPNGEERIPASQNFLFQ